MTSDPRETPSEGPAPPPRDATDVELLRSIAAQDEKAFAELRGRYERAVSKVCRAVAGSDREDCEQEVFVRIWRKAALFDPERGSAAAWLLTVARRTALNMQAGTRPPARLEDASVVEAGEPPGVDAFWLDAALARLSEHERAVIELAYYRDLSESSIARRLRVPLGSVKSWKRRGLNRLAMLLDEDSQ
jgi:RNA polymerase sigma-70 factor (ECF subfamily)